ncbi:class I adenylate-forming enzyme family protein [Desulfotruncus alcoholivorax]|uniref:class I adenylate-forming enzyme family protein n=1 Tax=Desulfotruncus alcoholivorax TaxID=265477 RepID=UPI00041C517E|nr:class I adenylate-forming enzyme family protein [Desulfotruncus alcoholivorax]
MNQAVDLSYIAFNPAWGYEAMPPVPEIPLQDLIRRFVEVYRDKTALISLNHKITFGQMDEYSDRLAVALIAMGVKKGDRVATMLPNCAQHVIAFHGIIKTGAVSVPCNVMLKADELAYLLNDCEAQTVICLDLFFPLFQALLPKIPVKNIITVHLKDFSTPDAWVPPTLKHDKMSIPGARDFMEILNTPVSEVPRPEITPFLDLALILYTAGTTGFPKGVMETHYNMVYNCLSHSHLMNLNSGNVNLQIMPMFHTSGYFLGLHPVLYQGGTVVLVPMFDPGELLKIIDRYKINTLFAPPTLFVALINHPDLPKYDLGHFKLATGCGAPVPTALQKKWKELTGVDLTNGWGMTETNCGGIMSLPNKKNLDSIGVPVAGEVKIIDPNGKTLPRGEVGEICFRGPQVAAGYWKKPDETARAFDPDGWLYTGDAGYMDQDGFIYFVDRIKDLIISSGYNISPFEVESVLMKHPAVAESAVIGIPDPYRGETVKAFITLKSDSRNQITVEDIDRYCRENMATYKRPRLFEFMNELPKSAVGKVLKRKLRDLENSRAEPKDSIKKGG